MNQPEGGTLKKPTGTTDTISPEELLTITDSGPGPKYETFLIESEHFSSVTVYIKQTTNLKALFDPPTREDWGEQHPGCCVYGEASIWTFITLLGIWRKNCKLTKLRKLISSSFQVRITLFVCFIRSGRFETLFHSS